MSRRKWLGCQQSGNSLRSLGTSKQVKFYSEDVIPAQAGIQSVRGQPCGACWRKVGVLMVVLRYLQARWIPACAGMTLLLYSTLPRIALTPARSASKGFGLGKFELLTLSPSDSDRSGVSCRGGQYASSSLADYLCGCRERCDSCLFGSSLSRF